MQILFQALAEALASPSYGIPEWICAPGREWPLFEPVVQIAARQPDARWGRAVEALAGVDSASPEARRGEYEILFVGRGRPKIWLYECYHINGRIPGPASFTVKSLYEQAGLEAESAELPDHAALELAFLAYLCEQETQSRDAEWGAARRLFIKSHAGKWLPAVGRALMACEYPAWRAVGHVLAASLSSRPPMSLKTSEVSRPQISREVDCDLCGFCVQTCPTRALGIREDDQATSLWLNSGRCVGCDRCVRICPAGVLALEETEPSQNLVLLRQSPRAACPRCGAFTVSKIEIEAIAARLGEHPAWLDNCLDCRSSFMEMK